MKLETHIDYIGKYFMFVGKGKDHGHIHKLITGNKEDGFITFGPDYSFRGDFFEFNDNFRLVLND